MKGADRYVVYRRYDGGSWYQIGTTKKAEYSDSYIVRGADYWYTVKAISKKNKRVTSLYSPWITTMTYAWVP